ncbi:hypothetical protein Trydic_g6185 [Trypoxylus dichotomus]
MSEHITSNMDKSMATAAIMLSNMRLHEEDISTTRTTQVGVPQGTLLGLFLFNIHTSDVPQSKTSIIAQFTGDTAIYYG